MLWLVDLPWVSWLDYWKARSSTPFLLSHDNYQGKLRKMMIHEKRCHSELVTSKRDQSRRCRFGTNLCFPCWCSQRNHIPFLEQVLPEVWVSEHGWVTDCRWPSGVRFTCIKTLYLFLIVNLPPSLRLEFVMGFNHRGKPRFWHLFLLCGR